MANEINANVSHLRGIDPELDRLLNSGGFSARIIARIRTPVTRYYRELLKKNVERATTSRTGTLRKTATVRSKPARSSNVTLRQFDLRANFPLTAFRRQPGYGRRGGRRSGQYGFVLNARRGFIGETFADETARNHTIALIRTAIRTELSLILRRVPPTRKRRKST